MCLTCPPGAFWHHKNKWRAYIVCCALSPLFVCLFWMLNLFVLSMASRVILRPRAWNSLFHVDCPRSRDESGRGWGWRCHSWRGLIRYVSETWDVSLSPINHRGNPTCLNCRPTFFKLATLFSTLCHNMTNNLRNRKQTIEPITTSIVSMSLAFLLMLLVPSL